MALIAVHTEIVIYSSTLCAVIVDEPKYRSRCLYDLNLFSLTWRSSYNAWTECIGDHNRERRARRVTLYDVILHIVFLRATLSFQYSQSCCRDMNETGTRGSRNKCHPFLVILQPTPFIGFVELYSSIALAYHMTSIQLQLQFVSLSSAWGTCLLIQAMINSDLIKMSILAYYTI